jgi:hypothetical protein
VCRLFAQALRKSSKAVPVWSDLIINTCKYMQVLSVVRVLLLDMMDIFVCPPEGGLGFSWLKHVSIFSSAPPKGAWVLVG